MGRLWLLSAMTALPCFAAELEAGRIPDAAEKDVGEPVVDAEVVVPNGPAPPAPRRAAPAPASRVPRRAVSAVRRARGRRGRPRGVAGPCVVKETARYRVTFGIFGQVAEATLSLTPEVGPVAAGKAPSLLLRAVGAGSGNVLGFGKMDKSVETEFDARTLGTRRWSSVRKKAGKSTADAAEQAQPGKVALLRQRAGENDLAESFQRTAPVFDPLSFLLRLRLAPPSTATVYEVLDGRALWLAAVSAARVDGASAGLLRVDGKLDPIYWSGGPDKGRSSYAFSLFFTRDRFRTPVRLLVPYGLGEVRAELVQVERPAGGRGIAVGSGQSCDVPRRRSFWRSIARGWAKEARAARSRARP
jgi:hypothetical protein